MKISIHELKDVTSIEFKADYSKQIESIVDFISIQPALIKGTLRMIDHELVCDVHVDVETVLACSKTLKPVNYSMNFDAEIIFGDSEDADYPLTETIDLSDIIFGYIISEKPYTIYHPDAIDTSFEKEKSPHPAFADLDKLLKK
ncbi:MAG: hypothetical protein V3569_00820 [Acholeplasmataceae bacterium]|nr:hypothetical protein [Acholeplasmataceae bacterium]